MKVTGKFTYVNVPRASIKSVLFTPLAAVDDERCTDRQIARAITSYSRNGPWGCDAAVYASTSTGPRSCSRPASSDGVYS